MAGDVNRRKLLMGLGVGTVGAISSPAAYAAPAAPVQDAPPTDASMIAEHVPFYGQYQAGITTPRPASGIVAAFDIVVTSLDEVERMLRTLTERISFLTQGGEVPLRDPKLPPSDSGLLGPTIAPDNLTITLGLGDSFFARLPELAALKPTRLERMAQFPNDALDIGQCHGDLSLQFCANLQDTNIHALRDIVKSLSEFAVVRWVIEGSVPSVPPAADGTTPSARNFLGFRDGSANPDSADQGLMERIVWVSSADEPAWAANGTYQAVRIIRNFVERWDRTALGEQEQIFGRTKMTGAPMGAGTGATEHDVPDYAADPDGKVTRLDAHIRLANPRTKESDANLMLRRPFNYSRGVEKNGQLDQGLIFICYQADLRQGFIAVQERLNGEPLEEYIKPVGGGYFFIPPGVSGPDDYLASGLISEAKGA